MRKKWPQWTRRLLRTINPRSSGVPISHGVMRLIWKGDAARQAGDWATAAAAFGGALARAPHLAHLWVQYGHMLREAGRRDEAREAYERAIALEPGDREPHLLLVRLARITGDPASALQHALALFRLDPGDARAQTILLQALSVGKPGHAEPLAEGAAAIGGLTLSTAQPSQPPATLYIDVGDLIAHLADSRLPSGLQRVEIEVTRAALSRNDPTLALCCWSPAADAWKPLTTETFLTLVNAAASGIGDVDWSRYLNLALLMLASSSSIVFSPGSTLLNLGMAWNDPLYHPAVAREKARGRLRFAAIACDVIPLVRPDEIPADIVATCADWLDALADLANVVVAISSATRDEIVGVSAARGKAIARDRIAVVPLDATFTSARRGTTDVLARHGLKPGGYALYVSTIEPRKNHLAALATWARLIADASVPVPDLVCVGRKGWRSEAVEKRLSTDRVLARKVHLLDQVTDDDLDEIYDACAFLFYPSLHEGWGLPITEALARGKVPVVGRNSSLPEAGGKFAVYVDATSPADMAAVIGRFLREPAALAAREVAIREGFHPRSWLGVADEMIAVALGKTR